MRYNLDDETYFRLFMAKGLSTKKICQLYNKYHTALAHDTEDIIKLRKKQLDYFETINKLLIYHYINKKNYLTRLPLKCPFCYDKYNNKHFKNCVYPSPPIVKPNKIRLYNNPVNIWIRYKMVKVFGSVEYDRIKRKDSNIQIPNAIKYIILQYCLFTGKLID
jgi:hypothetical protein